MIRVHHPLYTRSTYPDHGKADRRAAGLLLMMWPANAPITRPQLRARSPAAAARGRAGASGLLISPCGRSVPVIRYFIVIERSSVQSESLIIEPAWPGDKYHVSFRCHGFVLVFSAIERTE
jgi:hypothetical protein